MAEYRIVDRIGQGGMGIVYRAVQEPLDRPVAIKILPSSLMHASGTAVPRFLREIQACTKLNHPNIIRIIDCGEMSGQPFYAMEFLEAQTLREMLADSGPLPCTQVIEIFRQMLEALEYCHTQGIIHRDVKPHNIMVDHLNHATLMDFGLVKMLERSGITHSKRIVGSPNYMPPEMIQGKDVGVQADLWSLGCVMYELLTGERAFPGKVIRDIGLLILKSEPVPIAAKRPDCPVGLVQVIAGCLKKETEDRYQRADHVVKDLARVEAGRAPMGPATLGASLPAVPRSAVPPELAVARTTKKSATQRATGRAAAVSTIVGLPADLGDRPRWSLRSLVPRTWLERMVAAGALVVVVLALIIGSLVNVTNPRPRETAPDVRLDIGHDFLELRWMSAEPYRGSASVVRSDGGGDSGDIVEVAARKDHHVRLAGLDRGVSYAVTLKAGERVIWRATAKTLAAADLADRLESAIKGVEPAALAARLEADLAALTAKERQAGAASTRLAAVREAHARVIQKRLAEGDVAGHLARFKGQRHDYFLDDTVLPGRKRATWMAVEALEDLRVLCAGIDLLTVPKAADTLAGTTYGPVPDASLAAPIVLSVDLATVGGTGAGPIALWTRTGFPDSQAIQKGHVVQPVANCVADLARAVALPAGVKRLELALKTTGLSPLARVVLWAGVDSGNLSPVAVFRGGRDVGGWTHFAVEPRLFEGPHAVRLEFATSEALTPVFQQAVKVLKLELRYLVGGGH